MCLRTFVLTALSMPSTVCRKSDWNNSKLIAFNNSIIINYHRLDHKSGGKVTETSLKNASNHDD